MTAASWHQRALELYRYGLNDARIAEKVSRTPSTICRWRRDNGLVANRSSGGHLINRKTHDERLAMYRSGLSDAAIARALGMRRGSVHHWRDKHGLPSHFPSGAKMARVTDEERRLALYRKGLSDAAIARDIGVHTTSIFKWRRRRQLIANTPDRDWARGPTVIVSFDADVGEGGFNRHGLIADDAAAEWLEENGSTVW